MISAALGASGGASGTTGAARGGTGSGTGAATAGASGAGAKALSMLDLHNPEMNWVKIAEGLGVEASRATTCEEFASQYAAAMQQKGPRLIEVMI